MIGCLPPSVGLYRFIFTAMVSLGKICNNCAHKTEFTKRTISLIVITPVANTRAFGGVATGNINANEAEAVTGSIRYSGLILKSRA